MLQQLTGTYAGFLKGQHEKIIYNPLNKIKRLTRVINIKKIENQEWLSLKEKNITLRIYGKLSASVSTMGGHFKILGKT